MSGNLTYKSVGYLTGYYNNWFGANGIVGLVAQTERMTKCSGVEWTARTPPKRQAEGSNPSEPAFHTGSYTSFDR